MESYSTYSRLKWETKASILHVIEKNMIMNEQNLSDSLSRCFEQAKFVERSPQS